MDRFSPFVILGMPQSGASAVAEALSKIGVFFGEEGRFEQKDLANLNLRLLSAFQMHMASWSEIPTEWQSYPESWAFRKELSAFLTKSFSGRERWGIKQQTASLIAPLYREVFSELGMAPHYVVCVRHPEGIGERRIAWSHGETPAMGPAALGAWLNSTLGVLRAVEGAQFSVVVYEDLVKNPQGYLERIVGGPVKAQCFEADSHDSLDEYPELVHETYEVCRRLGRGEEVGDRLNSAIREFDIWREMLAPPAPPGTQVGLAWTERGVAKVSQVPFLPTGDWQTVRLPVEAPSSTPLAGLLYGRPCRVWIRRSVWTFEGGLEPAMLVSGPGSHLVEVDGMVRLDGAYESQQVSVVTPSRQGPYVLELEFLLETGPQITVETANRLVSRLHQCSARYEALASGR